MERIGNLLINEGLVRLVRDEIAPGTGIDPERFWEQLGDVVADLIPENQRLLGERQRLQRLINNWLHKRRGQPIDLDKYVEFLHRIGYIKPDRGDFQVQTKNVDDDLKVAGPQLVVPLGNARFAVNAANRWRSWWGALYESDVIPTDGGCEIGPGYNPSRGARVVAYTDTCLDQQFPLAQGSHANVERYYLSPTNPRQLLAAFAGGQQDVPLADPTQFIGYTGDAAKPRSILISKNRIRIELRWFRDDSTVVEHHAGVQDIWIESARTTIEDLEDATCAVDAADKVEVYRNWNGLMRGTLDAHFQKGDVQVHRMLAPDLEFFGPDDQPFTVPGRSLLLVRNVGIHLFTDAVTLEDGTPIPEGILDAAITAFSAMHDLTSRRNSKTGSIYIVKPKLHEPDEVAFTVRLFRRIEDMLGLPRNTIKLGIMDEEERTSVNLKECCRQALDILIFINTGFLDRTGDKIATWMYAGALLPTAKIKAASWMDAYERNNVAVGLAIGLHLCGQIGKGMFAMPDALALLVAQKIAHPQAGANTAWVPSPTAAALHAWHYIMVNVVQRQRELAGMRPPRVADIVRPPLVETIGVGNGFLTPAEIEGELRNLVQGILGYVSRWVGLGIGCSKVRDLNDVNLMEDLATLRIKALLLANWLYWGVITKKQLLRIFKEMAVKVDQQNAGVPGYRKMADDFDKSVEFQSALELVLQARKLPRGYTTYILNRRRRQVKAAA